MFLCVLLWNKNWLEISQKSSSDRWLNMYNVFTCASSSYRHLLATSDKNIQEDRALMSLHTLSTKVHTRITDTVPNNEPI